MTQKALCACLRKSLPVWALVQPRDLLTSRCAVAPFVQRIVLKWLCPLLGLSPWSSWVCSRNHLHQLCSFVYYIQTCQTRESLWWRNKPNTSNNEAKQCKQSAGRYLSLWMDCQHEIGLAANPGMAQRMGSLWVPSGEPSLILCVLGGADWHLAFHKLNWDSPLTQRMISGPWN